MTLSFSELMAHYSVPRDAGIFFLVSVAAVVAVLVLIALYCRGRESRVEGHSAAGIRERTLWTVERFAEIMFSDTSMLAFISAYVMLDWFVADPAARSFWDSYSDFILLGLIILSCVLNTILDRAFLPLKRIRQEERASLRLVSMIYMFVIFLYIKFIYKDNNYDSIIVYFIGLMIGRFVFFGASLREFLDAVRQAMHDLGMVAVALVLTAFMAWYGFGTGYLLRVNGVVVSLLIAHLYLIVALFLLVRLGFVKLLAPVPRAERAAWREEAAADTRKVPKKDGRDRGRKAVREERREEKRDQARLRREMESEWDGRNHAPVYEEELTLPETLRGHQRAHQASNVPDAEAGPTRQGGAYAKRGVRPQSERKDQQQLPERPSRQPFAGENPQRKGDRRRRHSRNFVALEEEPEEITFEDVDQDGDEDGYLDD